MKLFGARPSSDLPSRVIVLDVETTGVLRHDRVVSLGAVRIADGKLLQKPALHLVFDPRRNNHPEAERVHGFDDWTTRHQDLFADLGPLVYRWLAWAELIVCHNAAFDMHYVQREIRKSGGPPLNIPTACTMEIVKQLGALSSASLDTCITDFGASRSSRLHGAIEDAMLTAGLLLHLHGIESTLYPSDGLPTPTNFKVPPPRPKGILPRRETKRASPRFDWP